MTLDHTGTTPNHPRRRRVWALATAVIALAAVGALSLAVVRPAAAQRPASRTFLGTGSTTFQGGFDAQLSVSADGALVFAGGPIPFCVAGEQGEIRSVITQDSTAAAAFGSWTGQCTGAAEQSWHSQATAVDQPFQPGPARACAVAIFRVNGAAVAAGQWCDDVQLTPAP